MLDRREVSDDFTVSEDAKRAARSRKSPGPFSRWLPWRSDRHGLDTSEDPTTPNTSYHGAVDDVEILRHRQLFDRAAYALLIAEKHEGQWLIVAGNQALDRIGLAVGDEPIGLFAALDGLGVKDETGSIRGAIERQRPGRTRCAIIRDDEVLGTFDITVIVLPQNGVGIRLEDVTDQESAIELLEHQASHDLGTGLLRSSSFLGEVSNRLNWIAPDGQDLQSLRPAAISVVILGITNFDAVQETFGLSFGEQYASRLAERVTSLEVSSTKCGRAGFRQFGLVMEGASRAAVMDQVDLLHSAVAEPLVVDGVPLALGLSIGVAFSGEDGESAQELLTRAFRACLIAERTGERIVRHQDSVLAETTQRVMLTAEVARALRDNEIELRCQPKVELATGRIRGFEVMARWIHPTLGGLLPGEFLESIELAGLSRDFDLYIVTKAFAFVQQCLLVRPDVHVAVNIAPSTLSLDFAAAVARRLEIYGLEGKNVILEVVESALARNYESVAVAITALRALDIGISIDDFGTGYSSLARLRTLPAVEIKIDRTFARDLTRGNDDVIVRSILSLAENLGLECVAEGVESMECAELVARAGCRNAQGYFFGRPEPEEAALARLVTSVSASTERPKPEHTCT